MALKKKNDIQSSSLNSTIASSSSSLKQKDDGALRKLKEVVDLNEFEVESEFEEEGLKIKLPKRFGPKGKVTKISIVKEGGIVEEVDAKDLEEILESKPDIKKIVIEQVKLKGAERVSLLYDKDEVVDSELSKKALDHKATRLLGEENVKDLNEKLSLATIERKLNEDFFSEKKETEKVLKLPHQKINPQELPTQAKTTLREEESEEQNIADILEKQFSSSYGNKTSLRNAVVGSTPSADREEAVYRQQVLIRKTDNVKNNYYYKTKNHVDLFNIGQAFLKDFEEGKKSFGLVGENKGSEREKTAFGIAAFFNYHSEIQVTIVTKSLEDSFYFKYIDNITTETGYILDEELSYTYYMSEGMAFIEIEELQRIQKKLRKFSFEEFVDELKQVSDLIIWELPEVTEMNKNKMLYFPMLRMLDNVSLVVTENTSKYKDIHKVISYFEKYSVPVKGFLINSIKKDEVA